MTEKFLENVVRDHPLVVCSAYKLRSYLLCLPGRWDTGGREVGLVSILKTFLLGQGHGQKCAICTVVVAWAC